VSSSAAAGNFSEQGEAAFKAGDYKGAAYAWRHALVDDPQNPVMLLMLGQAMFANGQYNEAAGATQAAMQMLPKDKWGVVVTNFRDLYGNAGDYTTQLRALEKAVKDKPEDPAQRFLLGYHYAYLGYPKQAIDQLDKVLELQPKDEASKQLRDEMKAKLGTVAPAAS
jgi:tetratricopeptide (TPR) repeat protein